MRSNNLYSETFVKIKANQTVSADVLSMYVTDTTLAFVELSEKNYEPLRLVDVAFNSTTEEELVTALLTIVKDYNLTQKTYSKVYITYATKQFTLVPEAYYSEDSARLYLEFNNGTTHNTALLTDHLMNGIYVIYAIPYAIKQVFDKLFPQHRINHHGSVLYNLLFSNQQLQRTDVVLYITEKTLEIAIKKNNQFLLYNTFSINNDEDALYYVLFSMEQFELSPLTTKVIILGNMTVDSSLVKTLKKHIKSLDFGIGDKLLQRIEGFEELPHHFYFTLLNRLFCE